jgi:hypothetical protein
MLPFFSANAQRQAYEASAKSAINVVAMAHNSGPMVVQARALGRELEREQLKQKYENAMLTLAFSITVNIGAIIYFLTRGLQ